MSEKYARKNGFGSTIDNHSKLIQKSSLVDKKSKIKSLKLAIKQEKQLHSEKLA
jgi:hypothetical protein